MRPATWVKIVLGLIILGTVLQLAGVIAPMWIWLEPDHGNYTIGVGLFFRTGCQSSTGAICPQVTETLEFGYTDALTYDQSHWPHLTWLETLAAAVAVILCAMIMVYLVGFGVWRWLNWMNWAMTITAICTWVPLAAGLILYAVEHGKVITRSPDLSSRSFPWSALMCFIAGIIFVIVTFLIPLKCRVRRYVKNAIPPSADSKMILNPSTKSQLINRFFTPSPYREDRRQALQSSAYYNDQSALLGGGSASRAIGNGIANRALEFNETRRAVNTYDNNTRAIENNVSRIHTVENSPYNYNRVTTREEMSTPLVRTNRVEQTVIQEQQQQVQRQQEQQQQQERIIHQLKIQQEQQQKENQQQQQRILQQLQVQQEQQQKQQIQQQQMLQQLQQQQQQQQQIITRTTTTNQYRTGADTRQAIDRRQEQRISGHDVVLARHGQTHTFEDDGNDSDGAETIYYTGRYDESRPRPLYIDTTGNRTEGVRTEVTRVTREGQQNGVIQQGYIQQNGNVQQTGNVVTTEVRNIEVREEPPPPPKPKHRFFRLGANMAATNEEITAQHYTVHTRPLTHEAKSDQVVLTAGNLRGDPRYNDTYIYRPYSEQIY